MKPNGFATSIWKEVPTQGNRFRPSAALLHGYDFWGGLLGRASIGELLWLQLRGELPEAAERGHFELLVSAMMAPGPRDEECQAAMAVAVGGAPVGTALSAGLACAQGRLRGGEAVENCMRMIAELNSAPKANSALEGQEAILDKCTEDGMLPGYGSYWGGSDYRADRLARIIRERNYPRAYLERFLSLAEVADARGAGWPCLHGIFAASLSDLGFDPRQGHALSIFASAGGILAQCLEAFSTKWNEFPSWFNPGAYLYDGEGERGVKDTNRG